jgi:hypothetical protein
VIISAADTVFHDAQAEWFPALAERVSISTAQGYEWLPGEVFSKRVVLHSALQKCATQTTECVEKILQEEKITVSHFYLSKSVETENKVLLRSFEDSPNYHVAFTNTAVTIFAGK